jgi:hypothetical protein
MIFTRGILAWAFLAYLILSLYWLVSFTGPAIFIAEIQFIIFGNFSGSISVIVMIVPVSAMYLFGVHQEGRFIDDLFGWIPNSVIRDAIVPLAFLLVWMTGIVWMESQPEKPDLGSVPLQSIESGKIYPTAYYARITGYSKNQTFPDVRGYKSEKNGYILLESKQGSRLPSALVVEYSITPSDDNLNRNLDTRQISVSGYVSALDNKTKFLIERFGIKVSQNVRQIRSSKKTTSLGRSGSFLTLLLGIMLSGLIFFSVRSARHRLRNK